LSLYRYSLIVVK